jgi:D-ribose pyranase
MKKSVLLNSGISAVVAKMGHTDGLAIADCGLPIRGDAERIDLAVRKGLPDFLSVLDAILSELCVERILLASEIKTASPGLEKRILSRFAGSVKVEYVSHEELKKATQTCVAVVRTGECTPFANMILYSGVTF